MADRPTLFYRFARLVVRVLFFRLLGGFRILHQDRVPKTGPIILAPNHVSFADPPAVGCACERPLRFMAQAQLFKPPVFRSIIRALGAFPVHRGEADTQAIRTAIEILRGGGAVLVFPEGRRGDGTQLLPANKGVTLLASKSNAKIVPVGITGTLKRLPKGAKIPRFSRVTVNFGEPFTWREIEGEIGKDAAKERFGSILMERIAELMREAES